MTIVHDTGNDGPGTHAVVIGVGAYEHFEDGAGALYKGSRGMGQLDSPPHSARELADWLITTFDNPERPLATVELLISDPASGKYEHPDGAILDVDRATAANVVPAVGGWSERAHAHAQNMTVFFFCGHGVSRGSQTALLLEEFGRSSMNLMNDAIDLRGLHRGMKCCQARRQLYFADACRTAAPKVVPAEGSMGNPIVQGGLPPAGAGHCQAPIYYATVEGKQAFGKVGEASVFTKGLLGSLRGAGADDATDDWRVDTILLQKGIDFLVKRTVEAADLSGQASPVSELVEFEIHRLGHPPIVPVVVNCDPEVANAFANLSCEREGEERARRSPDPEPWNVDLELGSYRFDARFPQQQYQDGEKSRTVRPPRRIVEIEV